MLTFIGRTVGTAICLGLMLIGAKEVATTLNNWRKAAEQQNQPNGYRA